MMTSRQAPKPAVKTAAVGAEKFLGTSIVPNMLCRAKTPWP